MKRSGKKKNGTFWRFPMLVLLSLVIGFNFYAWNAGQLLGNQLPMPFGFGIAVVVSGSMEPTLAVNDLVVIRQTQQAAPDDIIVYQSANGLVIHRVISTDGETIVTKGDNNNAADAPIGTDAVKGKMIAHVPALGTLMLLLKKPAAILIMIVLAAWLMERSYRREQENDSEEIEQIKAEIRRLKTQQKENEQGVTIHGENDQ